MKDHPEPDRRRSDRSSGLDVRPLLVVLALASGGCLPLVRSCAGAALAAERGDDEAAPIATSSAKTTSAPLPSSDPGPVPATAPVPAAIPADTADGDPLAEPSPAPEPTTTSRSASPPAPSPSGRGSFTCNAQGWYQKCPNGGYCMAHLASSLGAGSTREAASGMAEAMCNKHMTNLVQINNIGGRAYVSSRCKTISCTSR